MKLQIMIQGLNDFYKKYIELKQPKTYGAATKALLLKESVTNNTRRIRSYEDSTSQTEQIDSETKGRIETTIFTKV